MQAKQKRFSSINTTLKYLIFSLKYLHPHHMYSGVYCCLILLTFVCAHMCCSAHIYVCHNMHVEAKEPPVGVHSLLLPCGSLESTLITALSGKCLNSLSHLTGPVTFEQVGMGSEMEPRAWSVLRTCPTSPETPNSLYLESRSTPYHIMSLQNSKMQSNLTKFLQ